jgi:hypothetical protein
VAKVTVKLNGPIFDELRRKSGFDRAVKAGMMELVLTGEDVAKQKFLKKGIPAGPFTGSIVGTVKPDRVGVIMAMDKRPIRTWLEARTRKGVKLGKGAYGFQQARREINKMKKAGFFEDRIARELNG